MITNEYGVKNRQEELLVMIKDLDLFLTSHNISYSLCGGSLLGAIRHNGFIPWDDDIDIMMDRTNYNKLLALINLDEEIIINKSGYSFCFNLWICRFQHFVEKKKWATSTIDIFVMDKHPNNYIVAKFKEYLIKFCQGIMHESLKFNSKKLSFINKTCLIVTYCLGKFIPTDYKLNVYNYVSQLANNKKNRFLTGYTDSYNLLTLKYSSDLFKKIELHKFENIKLPITVEYDNYLSTQYGNYMILPPLHDRQPIHLGNKV